MNRNDNQYLGIVEIGKLKLLLPPTVAGNYRRLSSSPMYINQPPELTEIDLSEYEGQAMMVTGLDGGGWLWCAEIIDVGSPILTALVQQVFEEPTTILNLLF
ncbi:hypothetical protein PCC7424_0909 [Gloeothece citriformis PCC 7424]|uniref:Uncharacterized protein n=1 Tax=Gloeothece citriformis (strain PCC 7424) TaxID=65393 RepID=B7KIF9_GLOC7|nr:hypothetical protein [Gloeothece citriformis]ACK69365.1 hypothetical protein PCC7424_0909 [Gloeothece citriformis PCC 7424]